MICKKISTAMLVVMALWLLPARHAAAVVQLILFPAGGNLFVLQGRDLEGIAALDLLFSYDPAVLANPAGSRGDLVPGDAIFNFNPAAPGEARLFIRMGARAVNGSGTIITVGFDRVGDGAGRILALHTNLVTVKATPLSARVQILSQPPLVETVEPGTAAALGTDAGSVAETGAGTGSGATGGASTATFAAGAAGPAAATAEAAPGAIALGSVTMTEQKAEKPKEPSDKVVGAATAPDDAEQQSSVEPSVRPEHGLTPEDHPAASTAAAPLKHTSYPSVLERMKAYAGERTPEALLALFTPESGQKVRQEPPVAISDGETSLSVRIELPSGQVDPPGFSLRQADMVSLEQADERSWTIVLLPKKNALDARITVSFDGGTIMFPLVLSPPVNPALLSQNGSPEAAFVRFLTQSGAGRDPRFDLNGDGRHDYLDDYLFTAQYLATRQRPARKTSGEYGRNQTP